MKALVLTAYKEFAYRDVPDPTPADDEVLVEVRACGICGSDVHGMDGSSGRRLPPIIMGHEAAGVVRQPGSAVEGWKPGDRVTFDSTIWCGRCRFCRQGEINLCDRRRVLGVACAEFRRDGALAELVAIPEHILVRVPPSVSFEQAAMVEPVSIAVHAVGRVPLKLNDTAVVVGTGMIGLLVVQAARAAGCGEIIAVDVENSRLELARALGASDVVRADQADAADEVLRLTSGRAADVAFECAGFPATVATAIRCTRKGGSVCLVGNLSAEIPLPLQSVVTRELSLYGSCASQGEYATCLELIARGAIRVDELVSASVPLAEAAEWFHRLYRREAGLMKVLVRP